MRWNMVLAAVLAGLIGVMAGCVSRGEPQNETNESSPVSGMVTETGDMLHRSSSPTKSPTSRSKFPSMAGAT